MQAGSLTPVYQDYWTVHHYLFIDSTGAEYRLDQNTNGVWTTKEAIYVYYDSNAGRIYFRDGCFWVLGSTSSGTEQDAGNMCGNNGYVVIADQISNPTYVTPVPSGQSLYVWASSTSDVRALQKASNPSDRIAATWYSSSPFTVDLNITDGNTHQLAVYCLDWDSTGRRQNVDILDANGNLLNAQALNGSFNGGMYLVWNISGHVKVRVTMTGGVNGVISGLFFDGASSGPVGKLTTNYTYDILNHLTQVSMPRGANTQTRTFVYNTGNTVGVRLLSATNPENGTVTYTYNTDGTLNTKTDAKNQVFTYSYDGYKRVTQISVGGNVLRTFMYDSNTLDSTFSGSFTAGRLVAVQHSAFNPGTVSAIQFTEMYSYTQPGQAAKKRLQVTETLPYGQVLTIPRTLNLDATQTYDTEGKMTSVNYPTTYAWNGSSLVPTSGPTYSYQFDPMHRPSVLTDQNSSVIVNNLLYGAANEVKQISYGGLTETREYNAMLQMKHLSIPGQLDINYNFPTSTNNGKISSQTDNLSLETVTYQYDSLNRLLSASASGWNQTFGYDGFGSLVSKSGTNAPVLSIAVNPATNQIVGQTYDANGNQLTGGLSYDPENRLQTAPGVQYAYDSQNKRIWRGTFDVNGNLTAQEAYFYGVGGQKLGTYALTVVQQNNQQPQLTDSNTDSAVFFGGKRVLSGGGAFIQDRLGSARRSQSGAAISFYPYGEDKGTLQPNDQLKFATYTRDTATGLDYADQRHYANNFSRFMSPDPYKASGGANDPQSWNRYAYVQGDPINYADPSGLQLVLVGQGYCTVGVGERSQFTLCDYYVDIPDAPYTKPELHPEPCNIDVPTDPTEKEVYAVLLGEATPGGRVGQLSYLPGDLEKNPTGTARITYADVVTEAALMVSVILNRQVRDHESIVDVIEEPGQFQGLGAGKLALKNQAFGREGSPQCTRANYLLETMRAVLAAGSIRTDIVGWRGIIQDHRAVSGLDSVIGIADTNFLNR